MNPLRIQQSLFQICNVLRIAMIQEQIVDIDTPRPNKKQLDERVVMVCRCGNKFYGKPFGNPNIRRLCPNCVYKNTVERMVI